ncbi:MAG: hypothetical protein ABIO61_05435, partial [Thermomonas sp.]
MRPSLICLVLLAGCARSESPSEPSAPIAPEVNHPLSADPARWEIQASGEGTALVVEDNAGNTALRLLCPAGKGRLLVNVPRFEAISSEERLSFGQGGKAEVLVADSSGDPERGGVSGEGQVPRNLVALLSGPVTASYGEQLSGPHPAPPAAMVAAFARACSESDSDGSTQLPALTETSPKMPARVSPCLSQDGRAIPANRLRVVGTEPFWGARVEGRCVTYSHPQDQSGTRVWTQFSGTRTNGTWTGSLNGA